MHPSVCVTQLYRSDDIGGLTKQRGVVDMADICNTGQQTLKKNQNSHKLYVILVILCRYNTSRL